MKKESEKPGLKLNIQKTKKIASGPIISWQIDGETMETVTGLLLGRKVMTNLDSILKSRDITNKGPSSQSYHFSINHECMLDHKESRALKN